MYLLGVDVGTTHVKAGLFGMDGTAARIVARPTPVKRVPSSMATIDPGLLWEVVSSVIIDAAPDGTEIAAVGVAGMAETGLLLDRASGSPRSPFLPWFDTAAQPQAERLASMGDPVERFCSTGIRPTFKCSLAKLLWLRDQEITTEGGIWLGAPEWILYRLTGELGTDLSLAGRTYAFALDRKDWDPVWLERLDLDPGLFPPVRAGGEIAGRVRWDGQFHSNRELGLPEGTPIAVCGHDHVCGAFAAGVVEAGHTFDSMGTAETLLGVMEDRPLTERDYRSGFSYGYHVLPDRRYWLGGLSASGGSIEWLRRVLGEDTLTYEKFSGWFNTVDEGPGGILFFPYLSGSGSPHSDAAARGALVGISAEHGRADLLKAVLEGTAYELEWMRREAEAALHRPIQSISAAGGGTRNRHWMQIKADVSGIPFRILPLTESTLLGAALLAGIGAGLYAGEAVTLPARPPQDVDVVQPNAARHAQYQTMFENGYLPLQAPLRRWASQFAHLQKTEE